MSADPDAGRLLCLEEPENGIHPSRIPSMLNLLESIAVSPQEAVDPASNPLRQVIINTHSPSIVSSLAHDTLIITRSVRERGSTVAEFCCLEGTWRAGREESLVKSMRVISKSDLLAYLTDEPIVAPLSAKRDDVVTVRESAKQLGLFDYVSSVSK